ncbi:MAG: YdcF family protein [Bacteroidales bacterium]|nr:YdcF family protein [Bacteroidales bacterium]
MNYSSEILKCAKDIFDYLYLKEEPQKADAIIGFGHFDFKIPRQCASLYLQRFASKIIFTGGVGAGSADFRYPEAKEFRLLLNREFPQIPDLDIITEENSTNTGENLRFTQQLLQNQNPDFTFLSGIKKVLKVSNAYRQRRAYLTFKKIYPQIEIINTPAATSFETEFELYRSKNQDLVRHLTGETERMIRYPALDFIVPNEIPDQVLKAYGKIKDIAPKYN